MPEQNDATAGGNGNTPDPASGPSAEYKGLQRDNARKDRLIQELADRVRALEPEPSLQEEYARERAARLELEARVHIAELKAKNPDVAEVIAAFASDGIIPSQEALAAVRAVGGTGKTTESSGSRNAGERITPNIQTERFEELLRTGKVFG